MRFKIITRDEALDHLQRGEGDVYIVENITEGFCRWAARRGENVE